MSSIRELRLVSSLRPNLDDREAIQESFQEIISDLNSIRTQWNHALYPTIGSLPQGRRAVARADRNGMVDPERNGLDGSQIYMDMTSRVGELGGLLHNGARPKTIKEVVLETQNSTLARLNLVEQLLGEVNPGEAYDETEVKAWIRQLAANTWDPDELANGAVFSPANFTGDPSKSVATSIWQRVLNTRHLIGVEAEALTAQSLVPGGLLAGTTYLAADTSIIDALITLDGAINTGMAPTLQDVYNNSPDGGGKRIDTTLADEAIKITTAGGHKAALDLEGGIVWEAYNPGSNWTDVIHEKAHRQEIANYFLDGMHLYALDPADDTEEFFRVGTLTGFFAPEERSTLTLGRTVDTVEHHHFTVELGRQTTAGGGDPKLVLRSSGSGIDIESDNAISVTSGDGIVLSSEANATTSGFYTTGATHNIEVEAAGAGSKVVVKSDAESIFAGSALTRLWSGTDLLELNTNTGWDFGGRNASWVHGIKFSHYVSPGGTGPGAILLDDGIIGQIYYDENAFADATWQVPAASASDGLVLEIGAVEVTEWAPNNGFGDAGAPTRHRLYRDNIVKAKGKFNIDVSKTGLVAIGDIDDAFNIATSSGNWTAVNGILEVRFRTALSHAHYTVTTGYDSTADMTFKIQNQTVNGFDVACRFLDAGAFANVTSADQDFYLHFQVV